MRTLFLAFALIFSLGNAQADTSGAGANDAIRALVDKGQNEEAFELAWEAAKTGDPLAHDWLGWFYEEGNGVSADLATAEYHYRIAASSGENHARWRLGVLIDTGAISGSLDEAVGYFKAAAADDYSNAIVSLAVMEATGRGTKQDYESALAGYLRAARLGDSGGVRGVGVMFYLGQAVQQDTREAMAWFLVSAAMGSEDGEASYQAVAEEVSEAETEWVRDRAWEIAQELGIAEQ